MSGRVGEISELTRLSRAPSGGCPVRPCKILALPYTALMTRAELERQILELPEDERLEIAEAIWASLSEPHLLPEWQRELLDERLAAGDDGASTDWETLMAELWPPSR
jgi:putative addiction module component (TIGR02574 family)